MGNAGSMDQHTDFRGHNMPLKLPMPDPGELEERFATVLVRKNKLILNVCLFVPLHASVSWDGTWTAVCVCVCVGWTSVCPARLLFVVQGEKGVYRPKKCTEVCICCIPFQTPPPPFLLFLKLQFIQPLTSETSHQTSTFWLL